MLKKFIIALALVASCAFSAQSAPAADPKIVVVDIQRIMKDSLAGKDLKEQLQKQKDKYQSDIKSRQDKLKKEEEDFVKQKNILAKDALAQKQKAIMDEDETLKKDFFDKNAKLDASSKTGINEIQAAVQDIINDMAKEQGFNIAIPTSQLIYAHKDFDISDEVLKRLDKKLPKVTGKSEK